MRVRPVEEAVCPSALSANSRIDVDEYDVERGDTLDCDNCGVRLESRQPQSDRIEVAADDDDEDEKDDELDEDEDETDEDDDE